MSSVFPAWETSCQGMPTKSKSNSGNQGLMGQSGDMSRSFWIDNCVAWVERAKEVGIQTIYCKVCLGWENCFGETCLSMCGPDVSQEVHLCLVIYIFFLLSYILVQVHLYCLEHLIISDLTLWVYDLWVSLTQPVLLCSPCGEGSVCDDGLFLMRNQS